jgi:hypothetical protein
MQCASFGFYNIANFIIVSSDSSNAEIIKGAQPFGAFKALVDKKLRYDSVRGTILSFDKQDNLKNKENHYAENIISISILKMDLCSYSNSFGWTILDYH